MLLEFLRDEEFLGDFHLFLSKISGNIDKFHSVEQGRLDGRNVIGSGYEQHVRQVVIDVQIVIVECDILLRVKYFEESR